MWDVFANQNENFDSFATHSLLSLISGKFGGNWIVVGKFDYKFFWKPWKFGIETERLNQIGFGRATADITSIWNPWRREGLILYFCLFVVFALCCWHVIRKAIWRNLEVRNLEIFVYFQAAVSALLAVSVLYVEKKSK